MWYTNEGQNNRVSPHLYCAHPARSLSPPFSLGPQTELEREKSRKDGGDSAWIERTRQTEAELDWAKEMADRLDRVNQGLSRENLRLKSQFKSQEDDRKFLIKQLVAIKVCPNNQNSYTSTTSPSLRRVDWAHALWNINGVHNPL